MGLTRMQRAVGCNRRRLPQMLGYYHDVANFKSALKVMFQVTPEGCKVLA